MIVNVEPDVKGDDPSPVGQSAARLGPGDPAVLRASGDDIVLEPLRDLAPEVDLGDEGDAPPPSGGDLEKTKAEYKRGLVLIVLTLGIEWHLNV